MDAVTILKGIAAIAATGASVVTGLSAYNSLQTWKKRRLLANDASAEAFTRQFNKAEIGAALKGYLVPHCSPSDPTNREGEEFLADTRESLFDYLDRNISLPTRTYHLLLADTGMGKTLFAINYFARCKARFKDLKTCLVSLASTDATEFIKSVKNKSNTILIADALDEDALAAKDGRRRLFSILEEAADYKAVIITCRSQFFLSDDAIPRETPLPILVPRKLGQHPNFSLVRSYISPFSPEEVQRYIDRRFPKFMIWKIPSRRRAFALAKAIPDLAHRPMLLERLPEIANDNARSSRLFDLYALLVDSWIIRESRWIDEEDLKRVSVELALYMYARIDVSNGRHTPQEISFVAESTINKDIDWTHLTTRSLLNRDSKGNFKFAHKSILEFLVVLAATRDDARALDNTWTPFMKELFVSWGHTEAGQSNAKLARRILASEMGRTNIAPLFDMLGISPVRGLPDFQRCAERRQTSSGDRIAPKAWRSSAITVETIDENRTRIRDSEYNLSWLCISSERLEGVPQTNLSNVLTVLANSDSLSLPSYEQFVCLAEALSRPVGRFSLPDNSLFALADAPAQRSRLIVQVNGDPLVNDALKIVDRRRKIEGTRQYLTTYITGIDTSLRYQAAFPVSQLYLESQFGLLV